MNSNSSADEKIREINKTRVENAGFSRGVAALLRKNNILTLGGIANRTKKELLEMLEISERNADEILSKIRKLSQRQREAINPPTNQKLEPQHLHGKNKALLEELSESDSDNDIIRTLAERLGITKKEAVGPSRRKPIVQARDMIVYLLREYAGMSYVAIGRLLGGRDHTTAIHAHKKVEAAVAESGNRLAGLEDTIEAVKKVRERKSQVEKDVLKQIKEGTIPSRATFKKISDRNLKVLDLYREGLTLENIGNEVGVTRERVRQIVEATIRQQAINETVSKGIIMDSDVLLQEERKTRQAAQDRGRKTEKEGGKKEKRWSRYYTSCKKCGTTSLRHVRKGLCERCVGQFRAENRETIISRHDSKCDLCGRKRSEAAALFGRDLYITKNKKVLCRECFLSRSGKKLGSYKNYSWSRLHPHCKSCGTDTVPHAKRGLCENCFEGFSSSRREEIIAEHESRCDKCGINREDAEKGQQKDLYVLKTGEVLCRKCFQRRNMEKARRNVSNR